MRNSFLDAAVRREIRRRKRQRVIGWTVAFVLSGALWFGLFMGVRAVL